VPTTARDASTRDGDSPDWAQFSRPVPAWFTDAKLGIFVHWGAYSVAAWAEPTGELGTMDSRDWFRHNPYAEWYWNSIRIEGTPARAHHEEAFAGRPYDDLLDHWHAEEFDADAWAADFAGAGARYVIPTSKHHDGIALWDAPGTGSRNTVRRGPRRDLVGELAGAVRRRHLRFGVYYSGGLDWSISDLPPIQTSEQVRSIRPNDAAYAAYCYLHVADLIDRFAPDVLWNDIEWPNAGKHDHALGLAELFRRYYAACPDGVVNDRFGETHRDFATSEYRAHLEAELAPAWEQCRGLGFSFGYNQLEDERHLLSEPALLRLFVDVVSRGGNLLLNVGPTASGRIPDPQRHLLAALGEWNRRDGSVLFASTRAGEDLASPSDEPWVRWVRNNDVLFAFTDASGVVQLPVRRERIDEDSCTLADGRPLEARSVDAGVEVSLPPGNGGLRRVGLRLALDRHDRHR
jgi:alpha-L-fucosidase